MAAPKEKEQRFDQGKLQGMHEPLTVRVEKMRGNVRQPIELPSKGSEQAGFSPPGTNWTRDEVLGLENFILTKWSGGGYYEFTITDAKADVMRWQGVWDPRLYPERIPPNTAEAAVVGAAQTTIPIAGPQPMPPGVQPFGSSMQNNWPPNGNQLGYNNPPHSGPVMGMMPQQPQQAQPQPQAPQAPPMWNPQGPYPAQPYGAQPGPYGWQQPQPGYGPQPYGPQPGYGPQPYGPQTGYGPFSTRSRYLDDDSRDSRRARTFDHHEDDKEKKELEQKLRQLEMDRKEQDYKAALERQQQAHAQQMTLLQEEMRRLGEARNKGEDDEVRRMREERERERERAQAEAALMQRQLMEQQLLAIRQQSEAQTNALRDQLAQLARAAETPKGETDEFRRLREEQDKQAAQFERERQAQERRLEVERADRERERERFDRERRDEMLQREMKETREATERRFEQMQAAASNTRHDPMIEMLKENARASSENMREIARMQAVSTDKMSAFMVAPAQLAAIMKDNSQGADGVIRNIIGSVSEIGNLYKNAAETIMQMSGGGGDPPAARLIQEGIGRASEVAERFLAVKRDQVISEGKVKTAEAMRDQTRIQADAHLRATQMQTQAAMATGQHWSPPPPVANAQQQQRPQQQAPQQAQPASGLNGQAQPAQAPAQAPAQPRPPKTVGPIDLPPEPAVARSSGPIDPYPQPPPPPNSTGPSEEEVFGVALESVLRLRRGVAEGKLTPDKVIDAILQGVEHVVSNNIVIPAFVLFQQERWADFVDVMLPEAPQDFRAECVRIMIEEVEVSPDDEDDSAA